MRAARALRLAVVGVAAAALLSACGGTDHVRNLCSDVVSGTAELAPYRPGEPLTALQYALDRFALVEKAVSAARETGLPAGASATLRAAWLDPAVRSMAGWTESVDRLRTAVDTGQGVDGAFADTLALGTAGVDTAALTRAGYPTCANAFTAPTPASAQR